MLPITYPTEWGGVAVMFGDLYLVRMNGILLSQQCLNVFLVERTSTDYNAVDVAAAVNANVWGPSGAC